jgi:hypothetical protein
MPDLDESSRDDGNSSLPQLKKKKVCVAFSVLFLSVNLINATTLFFPARRTACIMALHSGHQCAQVEADSACRGSRAR